VKAMNVLLLLWTVVPVIAVVAGGYFFLRAGRRWEDRQRPPN
jgi:cytochrome c-type biogenesis protein CcmH/NrfF